VRGWGDGRSDCRHRHLVVQLGSEPDVCQCVSKACLRRYCFLEGFARVALFIFALAAFVALHIGMANPPLRDRLVGRFGEKVFGGIYAVVSLALLVGAIQLYRGLEEVPIWTAGTGAYHAASLVMLLASILFVGAFTPGNKALAGVPKSERPASGVLRITRHPMMWAFGLWAVVHFVLAGDLPTAILTFGIGFLALVGAWLQDGKKRGQLGDTWVRYEAETSYWPFGAMVSGKQPWSAVWPGVVPVLGGVAFWLVLSWLHPSLMAAPVVGVWGMI